MGDAQFLHKGDEALKELRHSPTTIRGIEVKDMQSSQRLGDPINVCKHLFSNKAFIAI
jgi:hypothetical protein